MTTAVSEVEVTFSAPPPRRARHDQGSPLDEVRRSIHTLVRQLSPETVACFSTSIHPEDVRVGGSEDLYDGTERVARALVRHLGLPETEMHIRFPVLPAGRAGQVLLGDGYQIDIDQSIAAHRRDIGAVLAHEVTHVFLWHHRMRYEDEILTDTAAAFLGVGWPMLDAYRLDYEVIRWLGYLAPDQFGYVLGRRALLFGEDPEPSLSSPMALGAYRHGHAGAMRDWTTPPLTSTDPGRRKDYQKDKARVRRALDRGVLRPHAVSKGDGYAFSGRTPVMVTFGCPVCSVRIKLPVDSRVSIHCGTCGVDLDCET
ncbi:hypothetical protein [Plantactinospora sp. CA-290183]|uniref:hypothetical protein n=1 Tax=Plantactinospora sp. CA-290183 TaxID=3240006 RepID=UPI003D8FF674